MIYLLSMLLALSAVLNVIVWYAWRCQDERQAVVGRVPQRAVAEAAQRAADLLDASSH